MAAVSGPSIGSVQRPSTKSLPDNDKVHNGTLTTHDGVRSGCATGLKATDTRDMGVNRTRRKRKAGLSGLSAWIVSHQIGRPGVAMRLIERECGTLIESQGLHSVFSLPWA